MMYEDVAVSENAGLAYMLFETFVVVFPSVLLSVRPKGCLHCFIHGRTMSVY